MYKRLICILLTLSLCVGCFAFTASATDVSSDEEKGWLNLFDYNPNLMGYEHCYANSPNLVWWSFPGSVQYFFFDIIVWYPGSSGIDMYHEDNYLNHYYLGNNLHRFTGYSRSKNSDSWFVIYTAVDTSIQIMSCRTSMLNKDVFPGTAYMVADASGHSSQIVQMTNGSAYASWDFRSAGSYTNGGIQVVLNNSFPYDYCDFILSVSRMNINSITAWADDESVPISYDYISSSVNGNYDILVRVDLRSQFQQSTEGGVGAVIVKFSGYYSSGLVDISLRNVRNYIDIHPIEPEIHWLQKIWSEIGYQFTLLKNFLDDSWKNFRINITELLNDISIKLDDLTLDVSLDLGISELIDSIGQFLEDLLRIEHLPDVPDGGIIGDLDDIEGSFQPDIDAGIDSNVDVNTESEAIIAEYMLPILAVTAMFNRLLWLPFLDDLLYISLSIGVVATAFGIVQTIFSNKNPNKKGGQV